MSIKLPQKIQALVGEIGEKQVLLRLALLAHQIPTWDVFYNLGQSGFDILLMNSSSGERICIEVKTRQRLYSTATRRQSVNFQLSAGEYKACDYLIAYFLDHNDFYIVPKSGLKPISSGRRWRFLLTMNASGEPHPRFEQYRNNWSRLHPDFSAREGLTLE